jgi:hypothetical protein
VTQTDPNANNYEQRIFTTSPFEEQIQVAGEQLLTRVKEIIHEGNVRRIIIKQDGHTYVEIPLTFGVAGVVLAPTFAAIGVLGALLAHCTIEVVRSEPATTDEPPVSNVEEVNTNPGTL